MENPTKMYDNLQQLLVELQKVKDLNNLANEYKAISAKLILSLQDYLKDGRAFSDSFNTYLEQTNKCIEETKNSLDGIVNTVNTTVSAFKVADGTIEKKTDNLSEILCQLKQQATLVEGLYGNCMEIEKQVRIDFENMTAKAIDAFSLQSNVVSGRLDSLNSILDLHQKTLINDHTEISSQIKTLYEDTQQQNNNLKIELARLFTSNEKSMEHNHVELSGKIGKVHSLLKILTIVIFAVIIVAALLAFCVIFYK